MLAKESEDKAGLLQTPITIIKDKSSLVETVMGMNCFRIQKLDYFWF